MKKLWWLICIIIVLIIVGIIVMLPKNGNTPSGSASGGSSSTSGASKNDKNKKYIYLINNEVLATRVGNTWYDGKHSSVTLNDLFNNEAFYLFKTSSYEKDASTSTIIVNRIEDEFLNNVEEFDKIRTKLKEDKMIKQTNDPINTNGWSYAAYNYEYSIPFAVKDNQNAINYLSIIEPTIFIAEDGLYTNDGNLKAIEATEDEIMSERVQEYISDNYNCSLSEVVVKGFNLNIDTDPTIEKVYLLSTVFDYPVVEDDRFVVLLIENDEDLIVKALSELRFKSNNEDEFWENYQENWRESVELSFADFDYDGKVEIIVKSLVIAPESFDTCELLKINGKNLNTIATWIDPRV